VQRGLLDPHMAAEMARAVLTLAAGRVDTGRDPEDLKDTSPPRKVVEKKEDDVTEVASDARLVIDAILA
jgi:hypothetical protein